VNTTAIAKRRETLLASPRVGHKIEMICDFCKQTFWRYPHAVRGKHKFCSRACSHQWQKRVPAADTESLTPPKPTEPKYLVVYDPEKREIRNLE
jgi:hypothetical protein